MSEKKVIYGLITEKFRVVDNSNLKSDNLIRFHIKDTYDNEWSYFQKKLCSSYP